MLDGSIIAFLALKLSLSCTQAFTELAFSARPEAANDPEHVGELAEAACDSSLLDNPDSAWIAAFTKTAFQDRQLHFDGGLTLKGAAVDSLMKKEAANPTFRKPMNVGMYQLKLRSLEAARFPGSGRGKEAIAFGLSPKNQLSFLAKNEAGPFKATCASDWLHCWATQGTGKAGQESWRKASMLLAMKVGDLMKEGSAKVMTKARVRDKMRKLLALSQADVEQASRPYLGKPETATRPVPVAVVPVPATMPVTAAVPLPPSPVLGTAQVPHSGPVLGTAQVPHSARPTLLQPTLPIQPYLPRQKAAAAITSGPLPVRILPRVSVTHPILTGGHLPVRTLPKATGFVHVDVSGETSPVPRSASATGLPAVTPPVQSKAADTTISGNPFDPTDYIKQRVVLAP